MNIIVTSMDGTHHTQTVNPQFSVGSLKNLIQETLGVPFQQQKLVLVNDQKTLLSDDSKTLEFYGLQSGSQVSLLVTEPVVPPVVPPVAPIQVLLRNVNGATKPYDVNPDETVSDFKRKVQNREGVAESQQHLIHQGKEMSTGRLSDYKVTAGSLIFLTLHLRGGHGLN
ncbi:polyubiquitin-like [Perca fluviatilis]|uniref:polyubiquitin-like n=1 Tax=Perca fluviatilis TaxID=8168 RepID=UPI00196614F4|nr:polyubiquitin-like [Perca fluviatilis]XP_039659086.1 polyubiquitin-like [Perca fluviatilis]